MKRAELDRLAALADLLEQAKLARFREMKTRARQIEDRIRSLRDQRPETGGTQDFVDLAQSEKWREWRNRRIGKLLDEMRGLEPDLEGARREATLALGRVQAIERIRASEVADQRRREERRNAF